MPLALANGVGASVAAKTGGGRGVRVGWRVGGGDSVAGTGVVVSVVGISSVGIGAEEGEAAAAAAGVAVTTMITAVGTAVARAQAERAKTMNAGSTSQIRPALLFSRNRRYRPMP
jgi:hypothetical protein